MKYAVRRALMLFFTMLIVSFLVFVAFDLISGDPATAMLGTEATPERVAAIRAEMHLDAPLLARYGSWLLGFFTGNLGTSYSYKQPVLDLISPKIAVTFALSVLSFILIVFVSVPLGILSARFMENFWGARVFANQFFMALPPFFTGIIISWIFGIVLRFFMPGNFPGFSADFFGAMKYLFFAAVAIAIPRTAMSTRLFRSTIINEMKKDYVRTAISRGNNRIQVLYRHVLKNSLVSTITFLAQTLAEIFAGSIVVEQVFAIPGLGRMLVASISNRDYPVVQAIVVLLAFWVVTASLISDIANSLIDPRIKFGGDA